MSFFSRMLGVDEMLQQHAELMHAVLRTAQTLADTARVQAEATLATVTHLYEAPPELPETWEENRVDLPFEPVVKNARPTS